MVTRPSRSQRRAPLTVTPQPSASEQNERDDEEDTRVPRVDSVVDVFEQRKQYDAEAGVHRMANHEVRLGVSLDEGPGIARAVDHDDAYGN